MRQRARRGTPRRTDVQRTTCEIERTARSRRAGHDERRRQEVGSSAARDGRTMPPPLRLHAVAFVSAQNHPILIRTFAANKQNELKYHYIAHTSLDVIEERGMPGPDDKYRRCTQHVFSGCCTKERGMLSWAPLLHGGSGCLRLHHSGAHEG